MKTFVHTNTLILLRMRNVSDERCKENQNTHFMFNNFFSENRAVCAIMWEVRSTVQKFPA